MASGTSIEEGGEAGEASIREQTTHVSGGGIQLRFQRIVDSSVLPEPFKVTISLESSRNRIAPNRNLGEAPFTFRADVNRPSLKRPAGYRHAVDP
jgi:hypothetical protein